MDGEGRKSGGNRTYPRIIASTLFRPLLQSGCRREWGRVCAWFLLLEMRAREGLPIARWSLYRWRGRRSEDWSESGEIHFGWLLVGRGDRNWDLWRWAGCCAIMVLGKFPTFKVAGVQHPCLPSGASGITALAMVVVQHRVMFLVEFEEVVPWYRSIFHSKYCYVNIRNDDNFYFTQIHHQHANIPSTSFLYMNAHHRPNKPSPPTPSA